MKLGFIGSGNMGSALASAAAKAKGTELFIYDKNEEKAKECAKALGAAVSDAENICKMCDFVFLGVKPNILPSVASEISNHLNNDTVIVSMAAGVATYKIEAFLGKQDAKIIRIMPNTPVSVGEGMTLWCKNPNVTKTDEENFLEIMSASGKLDFLDEKLIDAASAVSGCGPAFAYMFIDALADGGVRCGLSREKALVYAAQMLKGSAEAFLAGSSHPDELKDAVCSPGGSTIEGVLTLEGGAFRSLCAEAVSASYAKTKKLGEG
jgi:pyrroline-5-carboxylate reductase